ncbi:MAG TPA: DUF4352 domain-containing protein [Polyangiaceae bacterium]|nr:DUF4352 domain-containing protein [Polyangiaceae bacterium]
MLRSPTLTVVAIATLCACQRNTSTDATSLGAPQASVAGLTARTYRLGETATTPFYRLTIRRVTTCTVDPPFKPAEGVKRIGIDVTIEGVSDSEVPVNPFYALVADRGGQRYEATLAGCKPVLAATRVARGQTESGWISFDVPAEIEGAEVSYAPAVLGAGKPEVVFALEP